jgi:predicted DsbA family dithiol-disulfide isomerase
VPTFIANRKVAAQGAEDAVKLAKFLRTAAKEHPLETTAG